jgi:hypothetical protein
MNRWKQYCCEDISLIGNYNIMINDKSNQRWVCHHKLETIIGLSVQELKDKGLYYDRPADELIFLTNSQHTKLHMLYGGSEYLSKMKKGKTRTTPIWNKGKKMSKEYIENHRQLIIGQKRTLQTKQNISKSLLGHKGANRGKHRVYDKNGKYHYE